MQQSEITNDIYHLFISASKRQKVFIMSLVPFRTHLSIRREKKESREGETANYTIIQRRFQTSVPKIFVRKSHM